MKKINLVFAGQSNMAGAAVFAPKVPIIAPNSREFTLRYGFRNAGYPCGEFLYKDGCDDNTTDYKENAFFAPSMCSDDGNGGEHPFAVWSQNTFKPGPTLAPTAAMMLEQRGIAVNYAHIAKGATGIMHYFSKEMAAEYGSLPAYKPHNTMDGAFECFCKKISTFLEQSKAELGNYFVWLQGESDAGKYSVDEYIRALEILWKNVKSLGFDGMLIIRVDYFGNEKIVDIMRAQERFAAQNDDVYIMTRAASFFTYCGRDESAWFVTPPDAKYHNCRDSFHGYSNQHINEKGFFTIAEAFANNLIRLINGEAPILEQEIIKNLTKEANR